MSIRALFSVMLPLLAQGVLSISLAAQPSPAGEPLVVGQRFQMSSAAMGEQRTYYVHRPANYDISNARYPVIYVTDGNEHFQHVSATVDFLAAAGKIPPLLVVGIPNVNRGRDLAGYTRSPGPSRLLKFITDELAPKIEHDYRTQPYRILTGWSSGGLFALHSLLNAPQFFRAYVVTALAVGDDRAMPAALRTYFDAHPTTTFDADFFLAMDNSTGVGLSWAQEFASILQFRAGRVRDLRFTFRMYPDESHGSVPLRGVQDGLRTIFAGWELDEPFTVYEQGGLAAIEKHFVALSQRLGFPVPIASDTLFMTFNRLEGTRRYPEAEQVIKRAVELYPENTDALYYQARLYNRMGNKPLATEALEKALQISPTDSTVLAMMKELGIDTGPLVPEVHLGTKDLAKYVGRYGNPAVFEVERREDKLFGRTIDREYELVPLTGTRFHYGERNVYANGGNLAFRTDARGRVTGLAFENGGAELVKSK